MIGAQFAGVASALSAAQSSLTPMQRLKLRLAEQHAVTKRVNDAIQQAYPIGTRVEYKVMKPGVVVREQGTVVGYCHRWRLDLRIKSDVDGKVVTKVVSHMNANETTIIP